MKILLDECVTSKILPLLHAFDVTSVSQLKWNGLKNGKLLTRAIENGFDLVLTIDKNISYQQNLIKHNISIVALDVLSSNIVDIAPVIPEFIRRIESFEKGKFYIIK